jgi:hypothetical protein
VTLCAVCTVQKEMMSAGFLVEPQNQGRRFASGLASKQLGQFISGLASKPLGWFVSGLASKPVGRFLPVWPQNRWQRVSWFGPQNWQLQFGDLGLKITTTVSWFVTQNQVGYDFLVVLENQWEDEDGAGHTLRSSGLPHLEASWARVLLSGLKTGGGMA